MIFLKYLNLLYSRIINLGRALIQFVFITLIPQVFTPMINIGLPCDIILKLIIPIIKKLVTSPTSSVGTNSRDVLLTAIQHPQYGIKFQIKFVMHHLELYLAKIKITLF